MKKMIVDCSTRDYSLEIEAETLKLQGLDLLVTDAKAEAPPDGMTVEDHHDAIDTEAKDARLVIQGRLDDFNSKQMAFEQRIQIVDMTPDEITEMEANYAVNAAKLQNSAAPNIEERLAAMEAQLQAIKGS